MTPWLRCVLLPSQLEQQLVLAGSVSQGWFEGSFRWHIPPFAFEIHFQTRVFRPQLLAMLRSVVASISGKFRKTQVYSLKPQVVSAAVCKRSPLSKGCFDLFGVDVMVDSDGHPWLLEVNSNPALWDTPGVLAQVSSVVLFPRFFDLTVDGRSSQKLWQNA